jgi:virginiamycin A acetyltransferase
MSVPDPTNPYPLAENARYCTFVRPTITSEKVEVGEYTYYDASRDARSFGEDRVLYGFGPERFIMAAANHLSCGPSTYPFMIFPGSWQDATAETFHGHNVRKGDTVVGNDVWFGRDATVLPGVTIGDGAIIGAMAVVTRNVAPYTVVGGNPAQLIKWRYSDAEVELLQQAAWWDWPIEVITKHAATLMAGTPAEIAEIAATLTRAGMDPCG